MFKKLMAVVIALSLACSVLYCSSSFQYELNPSSDYVDNVHYDKDLRLIVVHVHAKVLWMTFNEVYGIKVDSDKDIEQRLKEIMGDNVEIVHLKIKKG